MLARGPFLAGDRATWTGSIHIVDLPSAEAAREFAEREPYNRAGLFQDHLIRRFDIRARPDDPVATLSGGNVQKVLLARVRTRWVAFEELADLDGAGLFFMNVNTPEEYERAREAAARRENNPRI